MNLRYLGYHKPDSGAKIGLWGDRFVMNAKIAFNAISKMLCLAYIEEISRIIKVLINA